MVAIGRAGWPSTAPTATPGSREAMRQRGLDAGDPVFPDLAFALPVPAHHRRGEGDWSTIGVGVMAYGGSNDDRHQAQEIYSSYVNSMKMIVRWLIDNGRRVRLFVGDTNGSDDAVVQEILADVQIFRPELDDTWVVAENNLDLQRSPGVDGTPRCDHRDPLSQPCRRPETFQARRSRGRLLAEA